MKKIKVNGGNVNKVYFSSAIVSIEHVNNDPHGNVYTSIIFANDDELQVSDYIDVILYKLDNSIDDVLLLEKYDYKIKM